MCQTRQTPFLIPSFEGYDCDRYDFPASFADVNNRPLCFVGTKESGILPDATFHIVPGKDRVVSRRNR